MLANYRRVQEQLWSICDCLQAVEKRPAISGINNGGYQSHSRNETDCEHAVVIWKRQCLMEPIISRFLDVLATELGSRESRGSHHIAKVSYCLYGGGNVS